MEEAGEEVEVSGVPWLRRGLGCLLLGVVVSLWVGSSYLMQHIYDGGGFSKPFFVTYLASSLFSVYMVGFVRPSWRAMARSGWRERRAPGADANTDAVALLVQRDRRRAEARRSGGSAAVVEEVTVSRAMGDGAELPPLTMRELVQIAGVVAALWFAANYAFNAALTAFWSSVG